MSTTIHSLVAKLQEETQSRHVRYAELAKQAEEIDYPQVAKLFRAMIAAERARLMLYCRSLSSLETHRDEGYDFYVCPQCGYASGGDVPEKCPVCGSSGSQFEKISQAVPALDNLLTSK